MCGLLAGGSGTAGGRAGRRGAGRTRRGPDGRREPRPAGEVGLYHPVWKWLAYYHLSFETGTSDFTHSLFTDF